MDDHDNSYKRLFSHPRMVRDLMVGFLPKSWAQDLDMLSLEKVSGSHVTDDLRSRHSDVILRAHHGIRAQPLYLLLEFQSTVDAHMAVRVAAYQLLLYQDLIRSNKQHSNRLLAPILPVVLYNGKARWNAPTRVDALIEPLSREFHAFQSHQQFILIDEGAIADDVLSPLIAARNTTAVLFSMENSSTPESLQHLTALLVDWLQSPEHASLRRAFAEWIMRVLLPRRFPGVHLPAVLDLQEVNTMLKERVDEWTRGWHQEGLREGLQEGLQRGLQRGRTEGRVEGRVEERRESTRRLLTRRFGPLPEEVQLRIETASMEDMKLWTERLFDAATLDEIFQ